MPGKKSQEEHLQPRPMQRKGGTQSVVFAEQDFPGQPEIAPQFWLRANLGGDSAPHALGTAPLALVGSLHAQHGFAMKAIMTINERKTNEKLS